MILRWGTCCSIGVSSTFGRIRWRRVFGLITLLVRPYAVGEVTAHGLRTTASTLLNESGKWSPDAIERSLAHADKDAVRGT